MSKKYQYLKVIKENIENGEIILFNPKTDKTHVLNSTATQIYQLCVEKNIEEIAESFAVRTENMSKEDIMADILNILTEFVNEGLIVETCD